MYIYLEDMLSLDVCLLGVIPKKGRPNKWRLIFDLSNPTGESINNGIDSSLTSLRYSSVEDAVAIIQDLGVGSLMAKLSLESAYCLVPIHPDDRPLLRTRWENSFYVHVDCVLPFGLASAHRSSWHLLTSCCRSSNPRVAPPLP